METGSSVKIRSLGWALIQYDSLVSNLGTGNSLAVQWLGLHAFTAGAQVQSLVRELRSCKQCGAAKKQNKTKKQKKKFGHGCAQREDNVKTQGEDVHLQAKERGLEQTLPLHHSEGTNPADALISDF